MDEQEMIRFLRSELYQAMERDPELLAALKHIDAGKGTFQDTAQYSERTSELLGQILSRHVDELPEGMREAVCKALLRERYEEVNGICAEVQEQLDAQNGIRLQPQRASYPAERVQQVAHALEDPTVALSVIQRRAKAPVANVSKSFHDDYIRTNAKVRNDLGLKPILQRFGTGCCAWCATVAGKWRFGEQPDDVFRRHDNCDCVIIYDTQVLRGVKTEDGGRSKTWEEVDPSDVIADPPKKMTPEEAEELQNSVLQQLTLAGKRDIITGRGSGTGSISGEHTFEKIGEVNPSDKKAVASLFAEFERQYQNSDIEHCRVITVSGEVYEVHGDRHTVNTTLLGDRMKGSTNEHNHVIGESQHSFSWEDLRDSADDGSKVVMAYDEKYRYYMIFPDKKIDSDAVYDAYERAKDSLGNDLIFNPERIQEGDEQHERIRRACEELGIEYSRRELSR